MSESIDLAAEAAANMPPVTPEPEPLPVLEPGPDGKPKMNAKGKAARKRGRPRKPKNRPAPGITRPGNTQQKPAGEDFFDESLPKNEKTGESEPAAENTDESSQPKTPPPPAGIVLAACWEQCGMIFLGPPGKFEPGEGEAVSGALQAYLDANNIKDFPPGVALAVVACGYVGKRLHEPTVMERLGRVWTWIKNKLCRRA